MIALSPHAVCNLISSASNMCLISNVHTFVFLIKRFCSHRDSHRLTHVSSSKFNRDYNDVIIKHDQSAASKPRDSALFSISSKTSVAFFLKLCDELTVTALAYTVT